MDASRRLRRRIDAPCSDGPADPDKPHLAPLSHLLPHYKKHVVAEVPELWRKHARQPWRVLFPDLDWTPPNLPDDLG
jgi:hypothetical protein